MKRDDRRTYDFSTSRPRANCGRVSQLMLDGWAEYYRWLLELEKKTGQTRRQTRRQKRRR